MATEKSPKNTFWSLGVAQEASLPARSNQSASSSPDTITRRSSTRHSCRLLTSEERLHLDAPNTPRVRRPQHQAGDGEHALAVHEQLELAIGLADVVELDALADRRAGPWSERERAATDGRTKNVVALGLRRDTAHRLVLGRVGWEVGVELARSLRAPHEACGEAAVIAAATGAADSFRVAVSAVYRNVSEIV